MAGQRPKIAHVLHRLDYAGAEILAAGLARSLQDQFDFSFYCLDGVGTLGEILAQEGFAVHFIEREPGIDLALTKKIHKQAKADHIQLFHTHQYTPFFYTALSRRLSASPPLIFTEHGRHYPDRRSKRRVFANHFLLRHKDRITAVGEFIKRALVDNEGIKRELIRVIYNGVNINSFSLPGRQRRRTQVREALHLAPDQPVIIHVARFHKVKDHSTSINAFAKVVQTIPNAILLLVGDGELRSRAHSVAEVHGVLKNVRFLGLRTDIPDLLAASDVFVLSSLSEGVSVTLLEAMAASLPIVATDVGGNREVVKHTKTGYLVPRYDFEFMAKHLITLLQDSHLRLKLGQHAKEHVEQIFNVNLMHDQYRQLYQHMLGRTSP